MQKKSSLVQRDQAVVWHPFTQMKTAEAPIAITKGKGALLWDEDGKEYIDAIASWWMNLHGHSHPNFAAALKQQAEQLEHVIFANFTHEPAVQIAEKVLSKLPDNQARFFFSDNGSTAVEVGLKMCFQYWHNIGNPKTKIIAFEGAYHGDTFGAMSVGGRSAFSAPFAPYLFDVLFVEPPLPGQEAKSLAAFEQLLDQHQGEIAGFIFEPLVQGSAGMRIYEAAALDPFLAHCKSEDILIIADEVMVGFGRTGSWWASDFLAHDPDIFCLSKGLTGGTMALGATTCSDRIFQAFWSDDKYKTLFHGHSCTGNPLACAVALASFELTNSEKTWEQIRWIEQQHKAFGQQIIGHPKVSNMRQKGVVWAFDLQTPDSTSYFNNIRDEIWQFFIQRGLLLRPLGNTVYVLPPYCITEEQMGKVHEGILALLDSAVGG